MAVDTLFDGVRLLVQSGGTSNLAPDSVRNWTFNPFLTTAVPGEYLSFSTDYSSGDNSYAVMRTPLGPGSLFWGDSGSGMNYGGTFEFVVELNQNWVYGASIFSAVGVDIQMHDPGWLSIPAAQFSADRTPVYVGLGRRVYVAITTRASGGGSTQSTAITYVFAPEGGTRVELTRTVSTDHSLGGEVYVGNKQGVSTRLASDTTIRYTLLTGGAVPAVQSTPAKVAIGTEVGMWPTNNPPSGLSLADTYYIAGGSITVNVLEKTSTGGVVRTISETFPRFGESAHGYTRVGALSILLQRMTSYVGGFSVVSGGVPDKQIYIDGAGHYTIASAGHTLIMELTSPGNTYEVTVTSELAQLGVPLNTRTDLIYAVPLQAGSKGVLDGYPPEVLVTITKSTDTIVRAQLNDRMLIGTAAQQLPTLHLSFTSAADAASEIANWYSPYFTAVVDSPTSETRVVRLTGKTNFTYTPPGEPQVLRDVYPPNGVTKLYAIRITERYRALPSPLGNSDPQEFPALPWPTTGIPPATGGGGSGGSSATPTVWRDSVRYILSDAGRTALLSSMSDGVAFSEFGATSGTWYFEVHLPPQGGTPHGMVGVVDAAYLTSQEGTYLGAQAGAIGWYEADGTVYSGSSLLPPTLIADATNTIGVLLDADARTVVFRNSNGQTAPITLVGTDTIYAGVSSGYYDIAVAATINAGQEAFVHGLPAGANPVFGGGGSQLPADVWLALNFEGGLNDLSVNAHPLTGQNAVTVATSGSRTSDGYIEAASTASAINYGAGLNGLNGATALTIEFDLYVPLGVAGYFFGPTGSVYAGVGDGVIEFNGWAPAAGMTMFAPVNQDVWQHVAFVWSAATETFEFYVDGALARNGPAGSTALDFSGMAVGSEFGLLNVSTRPDLPAPTGLRMDNVLITKSRKYTANFTPPGAITGGQPPGALYYFPFESGDTSPIANRGSVTASLQLGANVTVAPDGGGGFVLGDGAWTPEASYVSDPSRPITGACTLECWVNLQSMGIGDLVGGVDLVFFVDVEGVWLYEFGASIEGVSPGISGWHHLAVVRDGGASSARRVYLDGALVPSGTAASSAASWMSTGVRIGQYCGYTNQNADALYDDLVVTEAAKYIANFTPAARGSAGSTTPTPTADITAAGYNDLADFTGTGTFNTQATFPPVYLSSNVTLDGATQSAVLTLDGNAITMTSTRTLANATCTGTFIAGTPVEWSGGTTLDDATGDGGFYAGLPVELTGASTLDDVTQLAVLMFLAPAVFTGDTTLGDATGTGAMSVTEPQGLRGTFTAPMPTLTMWAYPAVAYGVTASAPMPTLTARGGHQARVTSPAPTLTATATTMQMARAIMTCPMPYVEATGRVSGQSAIQASMPRAALEARSGHQAVGTLPAASLTAAVVAGSVARATLRMPRATLTASATRDNTAKIVVTMPMLRAIPSARAVMTMPQPYLTASASGVQVVSYESYVLNMTHNSPEAMHQATRYTNWPFAHVVRLGNLYYGVAADGLYELSGTTDNGVPIEWNFETCMTDFGDPHRKTVISAYFAGQAGPQLDYTLRSGDDTDVLHAYTTTKVVEKRNHRQKFGLGRKNRYYSFGLAGEGEAVIDSVELEVLNTTRRI